MNRQHAGYVFEQRVVHTSSGSRIATYLAGTEGPMVFVVGGLQGKSSVDTPLAKILLAAAGFGARVAMMELPGTGNSTFARPPSMATMLADVVEAYRATASGPSIWIGASLGGWFTLLVHLREPQLFRSMCVLAPAINWNESYILPQLRAGQVVERDGLVELLGFTLPMRLIDSMDAFQVGPGVVPLKAPLHIIHGDQDSVAPIHVSESVATLGSPLCSMDRLEGDGHGVATLTSQASMESFARWLRGELDRLGSSSAKPCEAG